MHIRNVGYGLITLASLVLSACGEQQSEQINTGAESQLSVNKTIPVRNQDFAQIMRGARLFQDNCAQCHGKLGQGAPNWRQRDVDGKFPPPPLNGTGHTWHHPTTALVMTIKHGTIRLGGNMPPWKDTLDDAQIMDILAWIQAQWPDEIYAAWHEIDQRSRTD